MPFNRILTLSLLGGVAVGAAAYCVAPRLQSARRTVEEQAAGPLETARRILHQYNAGLDYQAVLWAQLRERGVELLKAGDLPEDATDDYQKTHADLWKSFEPVDRTDPERPSPARANYSNIAKQVGDGLTGRDRLIKANEKLLGEAMTAIDEALAVSVGEESGRSHAEANRLKGTILFHQGTALRIRAAARRAESVPLRATLIELAAQAKRASSAGGMTSDSGCEAQAESLRKEAAALAASTVEDRKQLAGVDAKIAALDSGIAAAESRRAQAAAAIESLLRRGIDFANPRGADEFRTKLTEQNRILREADRAAHVATHGDFPNARIDASGDFLTGKYQENGSSIRLTAEFGVRHHRAERKVLAERIAGKEAAIRDLESGAARLADMREGFAAAEAVARKDLETVQASAAEAFDTLNRLHAEAFAMEEKALDLLKKSAEALKQAAGSAAAWISDARERTERIKPEAQERSGLFKRTKDGWMSGYIQAQVGDPLLARAWVYCDRYTQSSQTASLLQDLAEPLALHEADAAAEREKAETARVAGIAEVKQAMALLEKAHKDTEKHWTVVAQAAGTEYLLALLGDPTYAAESMDAYRKALQGREEAAYAGPIASRLRRLEANK